MIKCHVHVKNELMFMDEAVFVEIHLPCLPPVGSTIELAFGLIDDLEVQAKILLQISNRYAPRWFYGKSHGCNEIKVENLEDLSFMDANIVSAIAFTANCDYVDIEISD